MIKNLFTIFFIIMSCSLAYAGFGDFLNDVVKEVSKPQKQSGQLKKKRQGGKAKQPDLIDGLGGMFGIKQKQISQIKTGFKAVKAMLPIGEDEETALGGAIAVEAFSRFGGEYKNDNLVKYINLVGKTVAEVSDRPDLDYHFAILNSKEQNAFAAPGGYIFVTKGLVESLKNEAELAGVLAHEIAHVTQKHMLKTLKRSKFLSGVSELTLVSMDKDPKLFSNIIGEMTDMLFTKGLDKNKEFEADAYGVEFAYRAGYNPAGLQGFLRTLHSNKGKVKSRLFSTHPSTSDRIRRIDKKLNKLSDSRSLPYLKERFVRQAVTESNPG